MKVVICQSNDFEYDDATDNFVKVSNIVFNRIAS